MPEQARDELAAAAHAHLDEEVAHVELHRLLGDEEPAADLGVRHPLGAAEGDLRLTAAQAVAARHALECGREAADDVARDLFRVRLDPGAAPALEYLLGLVDEVGAAVLRAVLVLARGAAALDAQLRQETGARPP